MAIPNSFDILQAVIEATPDAIFVKDLEGRYVLVNEAFSRFIGKSQADIVGRNDFELYPRSGRARVRRGRPAGARERQAPGVRRRGDRTGRPAADLSRVEGRLPRQGRAEPRRLRHLARHHRAARRAREPEAHPGSAVPLAEDGGGRPADRRARARLQQHPRDHPRQRRAAAGLPAQGSVHRRDRQRGAPRHAARQGPHRPPAGVLAPAPAEPAGGGRQRRRRRHRAAARADARRDDSRDDVDEHRRGDGVRRSGGARSGGAERRAERARRDARRRLAGHPHLDRADHRAAGDRGRSRAGALRVHRARGHRLRHVARRRGAGVRAVFHHQVGRARHRPRLEHGLRVREAVGWHGEDRVARKGRGRP